MSSVATAGSFDNSEHSTVSIRRRSLDGKTSTDASMSGVIDAAAIEHLLPLPAGTDSELDVQLHVLKPLACKESYGPLAKGTSAASSRYDSTASAPTADPAAAVSLPETHVSPQSNFIPAGGLLNEVKRRLGENGSRAAESIRSRARAWLSGSDASFDSSPKTREVAATGEREVRQASQRTSAVKIITCHGWSAAIEDCP